MNISSRFHNEHDTAPVAVYSTGNMDGPPTSAMHQRQQSMAPELMGSAGVPSSAAKPRPTTAARPTGWRKRMGGGARIVSHVFNAQNYTRKEIPGDELIAHLDEIARARDAYRAAAESNGPTPGNAPLPSATTATPPVASQPANLREAKSLRMARHPPPIHWIQVAAMDPQVMGVLGRYFRMSHRQVDDVLTPDQLPLVDGHENNLSFLFRLQGLPEGAFKGLVLVEEQFSVVFIYGIWTVITIHESSRLDTCWDKILSKLSYERSKLRVGNDVTFLLYAFIDAAVDFLFPVLESYGRRINWIEKDMVQFEPNAEHTTESALIKVQLLGARMNLWRIRELLTELMQDEYSCLSQETKKYMRDVYVHIENMVEVIEGQLELCAGLLTIFDNHQNAKTNNTLALLTNLSLIILPAQFLCGVYGMNFDILPELRWKYSYVFFWFVVLAMAGGTALVLWWRGRPRQRKRVPQSKREAGHTLKKRSSHSSLLGPPAAAGPGAMGAGGFDAPNKLHIS